MFYSQMRFVLLRRTQDLKTKLIMETSGILGSQTVNNPEKVAFTYCACHLRSFEGRHFYVTFEMQKRETNLPKMAFGS